MQAPFIFVKQNIQFSLKQTWKQQGTPHFKPRIHYNLGIAVYQVKRTFTLQQLITMKWSYDIEEFK